MEADLTVAWVLTAAGACSPEDERHLVEALSKLLSLGRYGTVESNLSGDAHNGPVHQVKAAGKGKT